MTRPNFIIAGERRSGTTTLTNYLQSHPDVFLHPKLDMAYFVDDQAKGSKDKLKGKIDSSIWKTNHSNKEYCNLFSESIGKKAVGEKSADYLFWTESHRRIKEYLPSIKLIITLRNPVNRAWSQYLNELGKEREKLSFERALEMESERIANNDYARNHLSYLSRGFYVNSLELLYKTFNKGQVHIVILENLIANPVIELKKVYEFLEVTPSMGLEKAGMKFNKNWTTFQLPIVRNNSFLSKTELFLTKVQRKLLSKIIKDKYNRKQFSLKLESIYRLTADKLVMPVDTEKMLYERFERSIIDLETLLDIDLSIWKPKC